MVELDPSTEQETERLTRGHHPWPSRLDRCFPRRSAVSHAASLASTNVRRSTMLL
jgi:hypothetical protein